MDATTLEWKGMMLAKTRGVTASHLQVVATSISAETSVLIWRDNHSGVVAKAIDETKLFAKRRAEDKLVRHWKTKKAASKAFMKMSEEKTTATKNLSRGKTSNSCRKKKV